MSHRVRCTKPTHPVALDPALRTSMESLFGVDFGDIRIHVGDAPTALGATAFASGSDLHFRPVAYALATRRGRFVLGHELAHVVQQRQGRVRAIAAPAGMVTMVDDERLEREADLVGALAADGLPAAALLGTAGAACCVSDQPVLHCVHFLYESEMGEHYATEVLKTKIRQRALGHREAALKTSDG